MSAEYCLPKLHKLIRNYHSLLFGIVFGNSFKRRRIFSFQQGMSFLIDRLSNDIGSENIQLNSCLQNIEQKDNGSFKLLFSNKETTNCQKIALCTPVESIPDLFEQIISKEELLLLEEMQYAEIGITHFALDSKHFPKNIDGFGFLQKTSKEAPLLGAIFNSKVFEHCAPEGKELITCLSGGARHPEGARITNSDTLKALTKNLASLLRIETKELEVLNNWHWPKAIPQYSARNHKAILKLSDKIQSEVKGLHIAANWNSGISLSDRITAAMQLSEKLT